MKCRKCLREYDPTANDLIKKDYLCLSCKREYHAIWRKKRRAAGLPASGSDTWDPKKKQAWIEKRKNDPEAKMQTAKRMREYNQNPEVKRRNMARWAINHRKESGTITSEPCALCGKMNSEAHHSNYDEPLLIVWLCRECHRKIHQHTQQPKAEGRE